jgi:uncharacterized membrane protein
MSNNVNAAVAAVAAVAPIALLAAASGARSMTGIAALARSRSAAVEEQPREHMMGRVASRFDHEVADVSTALAGLEMIVDKAPGVPDRIDPGPLLARIAAGAVVGASVARFYGLDRRNAAVGGGVVAFAAAHASFHLRAALGRRVPAFAAGLIEDALVIGVAAAGAALLTSTSPTAGPTRVRLRLP